MADKSDAKKQDERDLAFLIVGVLIALGTWRLWTLRVWPWLEEHAPGVDTSAVGGIDLVRAAAFALLLVPLVIALAYARTRARLRPARVPRRVNVTPEKPTGVTHVL